MLGVGKTKTTEVSPYERMRVMRARASKAEVVLAPGFGAEVMTTGEAVRVTVDVNMLLIVVVGGMVLDLFEESPTGGVGPTLGMVGGGLDARLVVLELDDEENPSEAPGIVLDVLLEVVFSDKDEALAEELLLVVGNASGLVALVILEFDRVDVWETPKVLDVGFTRAEEEGFKSVLLALIDVLDVTKEVTRGGPIVTVALTRLDEDEEVKTIFRTVVVLEFTRVVTDVLRGVVLDRV
jgi:hypothetical protein